MDYNDFSRWFLACFPDEVLKPGKRLNVTQVEILNMLVLEAKKTKDANR